MAITVTDEKVVHRCRRFMLISTVGCKLCVQWRYGLKYWQSLKDLKESHPVETVEFSVAQEIYHEPAFNWWLNVVLKKMLQIITLFRKRNARYLKKTHKFGIKQPKLFSHLYVLDENNGNTLWADSISK